MKSSLLKCIVLVALCASMFSFTGVGGEGYTIHVNNKLVGEYYVTSKFTAPSLSVSQFSANGQLSVYYNECGQIGKRRSLSIKDDAGVVLKEWSFTNLNEDQKTMTCKVKEILAAKSRNNSVKLYYSSERVNNRLLATIVFEELKASR